MPSLSSQKFSIGAVVSFDELSHLIDSMQMRKQEINRDYKTKGRARQQIAESSDRCSRAGFGR